MFRRFRHRRPRSRGQSLVEFAIVLPILLVLTMTALDFGRVYLGWINLQNMSRIGANYAANNPTAWATGNQSLEDQYQAEMLADAKANNCHLPLDRTGNETAPDPVFTDVNGDGSSTGVGDDVSVSLTCNFDIITPVIARILGSQIPVTSTTAFTIKTGLVATSGGGGGSTPKANFTASPTNGAQPLNVQFTDTSTGTPSSWFWDFGNGNTFTGKAPPIQTYSNPGLYSVTLTVSNTNGSDSATKTNYIAVSTAPPAISFTADQTAGTSPLVVTFDASATTGCPCTYSWAFGDGATSTQGPIVQHTYSTATPPKSFTVTLTVTNTGGTVSLTRNNYITLGVPNCTVPDFTGTSTSTAQSTWAAAGFATQVNFKQGNLPWTISSQTITGTSVVPCNSPISVSKN
jgi:PKD repeat protein